MLTIRKKQMSEFDRIARKTFEDDMVKYVLKEYPDRTTGIPESKTRDQIRRGIQSAEGYGFSNRGPVRFFIELTFLLGPEFDADPHYPWVGDILMDNTDQMDRADRLHEALMIHLQGNKKPEAIEDVKDQAFEDNMVKHLNQRFPIRTTAMGKDAVREVIRSGIERADEYGLDKPDHVCLFIEMSILLGISFDTDPQYPGIQEILADTTDRMDRLRRLYSDALKYRETVVGPDDEFLQIAIGRLDTWQLEKAFITDEENEVEEEAAVWEPVILDYCQSLYPEKCQYAGPEAMKQISQQAVARANEEQFLIPGGAILFGTLMLMLGHDCLTDPQFPWIDDTFNGIEKETDTEKALELITRLKAHAQNAMTEFPQPRWITKNDNVSYDLNDHDISASKS